MYISLETGNRIDFVGLRVVGDGNRRNQVGQGQMERDGEEMTEMGGGLGGQCGQPVQWKLPRTYESDSPGDSW